uniref:Uncharacterized protein n=1 Tax=Chromera velia CCMP2878 TaxID=1169474 RepID=A0A0G4F2E3_9ALVE|eukprot:Cvel_14708.t1-p1 / transcript=Cvel_14708.t1 / gene=Cvel_14708 / organism=Chromera_velia_CCMP2878 / gene_product=hypothetical protein / transcript_product=hypothetical protein / location=Cvel_scaffold1056:43648-48016(+) / protein_length=621 / sequence_SO=supercontig / SO=protein_coding / is_pseudo=false
MHAAICGEGEGEAVQDPTQAHENEEILQENETGAPEICILLENETGAPEICILLKDSRPSSEAVSSFLRRRDTFGIAWLICVFIRKRKVRLPFQRLDFSGSTLSAGKAFLLLLHSLPLSMEELCLDTNFGETGLKELSKAAEAGRLSNLLHLSLDRIGNTDMDGDGMRSFGAALSSCDSVRPLKLQTLSLVGLRIGSGNGLSLILRRDVVPSLRELKVSFCKPAQVCMVEVVAAISRGDLVGLESLDLDGLDVLPLECSMLAGVLRRCLLPSLTRLNLDNWAVPKECLGSLLRAFAEKQERPPLEEVFLGVSGASVSHAAVLGSGEFSFVKHLSVSLVVMQEALAFLSALIEAAEGCVLERVDLQLWDVGGEGEVVVALAKALEKGKLGKVLRHLSIRNVAMDSTLQDAQKLPLFTSILKLETPMSSLQSLSLNSLDLDDSDLWWVGGIIRRGQMPNLRRMDLSENEFGPEGLKVLMEGVCALEGAVRNLESLALSCTQAGRQKSGIEAMGGAFCLGKLPSLRALYLGNCLMADATATCLVEALQPLRLPLFRTLDVQCNPMSPDGVDAFFEKIQRGSLVGLETLRIKNAQTDADRLGKTVAKAQREGKLPSLRIQGGLPA